MFVQCRIVNCSCLLHHHCKGSHGYKSNQVSMIHMAGALLTNVTIISNSSFTLLSHCNVMECPCRIIMGVFHVTTQCGNETATAMHETSTGI